MSISVTHNDVNQNEQFLGSKSIKIDNFDLSIGKNCLYDGASLNIGDQTRYGFLGKNGAGKSTLLRAINDRQFTLPPSLTIFYVEQEMLNNTVSAFQAVMNADIKNIELLKKEQEIMNKLDEFDNNDNGEEQQLLVDELNKISETLNSNNVASMEPKARRILSGLGFTEEMQNKPTCSFSGGWQMRISLARGLYMEPQLLILDEPTNHLDLNAVIWLDNYLNSWTKSLILVSHNQDFIENTCNAIINLENKKLHYYNCGFKDFQKQYFQDKKVYQKLWDKYLKTLKNLKSKGKYKKENDLNLRKATINGCKVILEKPEREYAVNFSFNEPYQLTSDIITLNDVSFGYTEDKILFEGIDFSVTMNDRIVIVGANGIGKSTLLKLMIGELKPSDGEVEYNRRSRVGVYNQHFIDSLPMDKTPIEYIQECSRKTEELPVQEVRKLLGRFGLTGKTHVLKNEQLSGGQKARVAFASIYVENPNVILLDEPTNNLDIESVSALIEAINNFNGGVVVITHDIKLIEETECQLYVCDNHAITRYSGDINDYRDEILSQME